MGSHGIKDRVAIVGMGCTPFGEHWDKGTDDLLIDASTEAFASAGIDKDDVDAYWLGTAMSGMSGMTLARPLQLHDKPVTHVENFCATGSEALRNAAYAVASRRVRRRDGDRRREGEGQRLPGPRRRPIPNDGTGRTLTAAAMFAMVAAGLRQEVRRRRRRDAQVLARIAWKNHYNGARNPRAQFRKEMSVETICNAPLMAGRARRLRLLGCGRRLGGGDRRAGRGRAQVHRQADLHQGAVVRRRQLLGHRRPRVRLHDFPEIAATGRGRVRAGRRHRPPRASSRWPRCTTASPRPSSAHRGPRLRRARHRVEGSARRHVRPRAASCRSTPTAASRASATRSARRACA